MNRNDIVSYIDSLLADRNDANERAVQDERERIGKHEQYLESIIAALNTNSSEGAGALYKLTSYKEPLYVEGWRELEATVATVIDDMYLVMESLRSKGIYSEADRLRTLMGRLARERTIPLGANPDWIREIARSYEDQLTPKESRSVFRERDEAIVAKLAAEKQITELVDALHKIQSIAENRTKTVDSDGNI